MKNFFGGLWDRAIKAAAKISQSTGFRRITAAVVTAGLTVLDSKTQLLDPTTKAEIVAVVVTMILGDSLRPVGVSAAGSK